MRSTLGGAELAPASGSFLEVWRLMASCEEEGRGLTTLDLTTKSFKALLRLNPGGSAAAAPVSLGGPPRPGVSKSADSDV